MQKRSRTLRSCLLLWLAFATFITSEACSQSIPAQYTMTVIGVLGGDAKGQSYGYGVSPDGQVTGNATTATGSKRAFRYKDGVMTDLGALGTDNRIDGLWNSVGRSINVKGQVAGYAGSHNNSSIEHAVLYSDDYGYLRDLGSLGNFQSFGSGINANGVVTGYTSYDIPPYHYGLVRAFVYRNGTMTQIGAIYGNGLSYGYAINDSDQITGTSQIAWGPSGNIPLHAFLYSNGKMIDLGTLGGSKSVGYAINAGGQITGQSLIAGDGTQHAFLYSGGAMTDLGTLGGAFSEGRGINSSGNVVGVATDAAGVVRPFLYRNGVMTNLNDLLPAGTGWNLIEANGINDAGQIVGTVRHAVEGWPRAVLLNPAGPAGSVKLSTASLSLVEGGGTDTYTVVLANAPNANAIVTVSPGSQLTASPTQLTFTPANWDTPQTVTVQAMQNNIVEAPHTSVLAHTVSSTDARYNGITIGSVNVTIKDAVIPVVKISIPNGKVWTQPDLLTQGTAAPGATVILYARNTTSGAVYAVSAVAGADGNWSAVLTGLPDGTYELQPESNGITGAKVTVIVDSHAPVSTLSVTSTNGPTADGWYIGAVNLAVTAVDGVGGQGVARSEYTLDGNAWTAFPAVGLIINADGNHTVCYRSVDSVNNVEAARCIQVPIDATAPQVNPVFSALTNTLHLNAQDAVSGIASIEVSLDGGQSWTTQTGPLSFTRDGPYTLQYRVRDNAGNLAAGQTSVVVVTIPSITPAAEQAATEATLQNFNLGSFFDLAADSPWSVDVDWGDGSTHSTFLLTVAGSLGAQPHTYVDSGTYTVTVKVADQAGNIDSKTFRVVASNAAPRATLTTGGAINEGGTATIVFSNQSDLSGADTQAGFHYAFACDGASLAGATYANSGTNAMTVCSYADGPSTMVVRARIIDRDGGFSEYTSPFAINNVAPNVGNITVSANLVNINTAVSVSATFNDAGILDTHTATIDWGDGSSSTGGVTESNGTGSLAGSHSYTATGIYTITVTVGDKDGAAASATYQSITVVDPTGASVNGNARIDSPSGAMPANLGVIGNVNLQVRANYNGGASTPIGTTSFDFKAANLNFQSTAYDWLMVNGDKALVTGTGTINGVGNYGFIVSVIDGGKGKGSPDTFRIKIWDKTSGVVVYDSQPGMADDADPTTFLTSGKITIK